MGPAKTCADDQGIVLPGQTRQLLPVDLPVALRFYPEVQNPLDVPLEHFQRQPEGRDAVQQHPSQGRSPFIDGYVMSAQGELVGCAQPGRSTTYNGYPAPGCILLHRQAEAGMIGNPPLKAADVDSSVKVFS